MLTLMAQNTANYDDHPGWLDRLGYIYGIIRQSGANVVCLTEIRYTQENLFNTYAPQYWKNQGVTAAPPDPASMADQIVALLNAGGGEWTSVTDIAMQYSTDPLQWEGLTILSQLPMTNHGSFRMPTGDGNNRLTQYVNVATPSGNVVTVYNTHFALDAASRVADAQAVISVVSGAGSNLFVIAGDLNATPDDPSIAALTEAGYIDTWRIFNSANTGYTFASPLPAERIDYIWSSPKMSEAALSMAIVPAFDPVIAYSDHGTLFASDHLGLCATFNI